MSIPEHVINKVVYDGNILIDLTSDIIDPSVVLVKYNNNNTSFHGKDGVVYNGACTFDSDTTDATALSSEILDGSTAYVNKNKVVGSMPNRGGVTGYISTVAGTYSITQGYHDGSGTVGIDSTEAAKIIAGNIKSGVTILGVLGTYTGESISARSATATPSSSEQVILPGTGYDYLSQVTVYAIPYVESSNAAGGYTATIA